MQTDPTSACWRLSFDDVWHYQRIIRILIETDRTEMTITITLAEPESG